MIPAHFGQYFINYHRVHVQDVWAHFSYSIIVLNHTPTAECFFRYHPDLVWC